MGSRMGYEYDYVLWMDDGIICSSSDFIYCFEIRTKFTVQGRDGGKETIGSEKFRVLIVEVIKELLHTALFSNIVDRFADYGISIDETEALVVEAVAFAKHMAAIAYGPPQIAVELEVCTVQQPGETVSAANDRAMRPENMFQQSLLLDKDDRYFFFRSNFVEATRVEDVRDCLMEECPICLRSPIVGEIVTILKHYCNHVFHYSCIVRWLLINMSCPICRHPIRLVHWGEYEGTDLGGNDLPISLLHRDGFTFRYRRHRRHRRH